MKILNKAKNMVFLSKIDSG